MIHLKTVDKQKIGEQVLIILRKSIMLGDIKAGSHLKETVLSKELGVSRGPIREAIVQLENEGLVTTPSNGRSVVEGFSIKDLENLYHTRIQLEKFAISQITPEAIELGKAEMYRYVQNMEDALLKGERDVESDLTFHFMLIQLTGNKTLVQLWKSLNGPIKTLIDVTSDFTMNHQKEIIEEHFKIVEFLERGENEQAQAELVHHLQNAGEFYKQAAKRLREDEQNQ